LIIYARFAFAFYYCYYSDCGGVVTYPHVYSVGIYTLLFIYVGRSLFTMNTGCVPITIIMLLLVIVVVVVVVVVVIQYDDDTCALLLPLLFVVDDPSPWIFVVPGYALRITVLRSACTTVRTLYGFCCLASCRTFTALRCCLASCTFALPPPPHCLHANYACRAPFLVSLSPHTPPRCCLPRACAVFTYRTHAVYTACVRYLWIHHRAHTSYLPPFLAVLSSRLRPIWYTRRYRTLRTTRTRLWFSLPRHPAILPFCAPQFWTLPAYLAPLPDQFAYLLPTPLSHYCYAHSSVWLVYLSTPVQFTYFTHLPSHIHTLTHTLPTCLYHLPHHTFDISFCLYIASHPASRLVLTHVFFPSLCNTHIFHHIYITHFTHTTTTHHFVASLPLYHLTRAACYKHLAPPLSRLLPLICLRICCALLHCTSHLPLYARIPAVPSVPTRGSYAADIFRAPLDPSHIAHLPLTWLRLVSHALLPRTHSRTHLRAEEGGKEEEEGRKHHTHTPHMVTLPVPTTVLRFLHTWIPSAWCAPRYHLCHHARFYWFAGLLPARYALHTLGSCLYRLHRLLARLQHPLHIYQNACSCGCLRTPHPTAARRIRRNARERTQNLPPHHLINAHRSCLPHNA